VENGRKKLEKALNVLRGEVHDGEGELEGLKVLLVVDVGHLDGARLVEVGELLRFEELELALLLRGGTQHELVEAVVVPLLGGLVGDTALLQEVVDNGGSADALLAVKLNLHELSEARGVVVPHSLGISCGGGGGGSEKNKKERKEIKKKKRKEKKE